MQELETYLVETDIGLEIHPKALETLKTLKTQKDLYDSQYKALSNAITNELKTHFTNTTKVSGFNFVVKGGTYEFEFDMEKFKEDYLELFVKYLKPIYKEIQYQLASERKKEE